MLFRSWQKSTDLATFTDIAGATALSYQSPAVTASTWFRQIQSESGGASVITNIVKITLAVIPTTMALNNVTINSSQSLCYNATQTITTAGGTSIFLVKSGGSAILISGHKISMLPGTKVEPGGYMHAYITATGQYCANLKTTLPASPADLSEEDKANPEISSGTLFGCYPNPTDGTFKLWLSDEPGANPVEVKIYNMLGVELQSRVIFSGKLHEFSLEGQCRGIYLISVQQNGKTGLIKMIRQ